MWVRSGPCRVRVRVRVVEFSSSPTMCADFVRVWSGPVRVGSVLWNLALSTVVERCVWSRRKLSHRCVVVRKWATQTRPDLTMHLTVGRTRLQHRVWNNIITPSSSSSHRVNASRPYRGPWASAQMGSADPPGKMHKKLKSENMQKEQFSMFMLYFESNQGRQA